MKKTILLMLGLAITTASFANEPTPRAADPATQIRLVATTDQKVKLFIQPRQTNVQIILKDQLGHVLYSSINLDLKRGFRQQFDMADLAPGTYQLSVVTNTETVTKTIVVQPTPAQQSVVFV